MKTFRILHIIDSLDLGGAEKLLSNTVSEQRDFEHLIVTVFSSKELSLLPPNAKLISLESRRVTSLPFKGPAFRKIVKEFAPDIVHSHLYFATILAKAFTPPEIPLVFTQHFEFSKNAEKWYYAFADKLVSKRTHHVIGVSNTVLQDYVKTTSFKGHTHVVNNYIPDLFFEQQACYNLPNDAVLKMVSIGNIKPIKNQAYLLSAFQFMKDLPVSCDIYGDGPQLANLNAIARESDLKITFKGVASNISTLLPQYHLFVMPSLTEGFPLALFEAMACGLPVAVSDIPVFHEVLQDDGYYFPLGDPKQLRGIIEQYLHSPRQLAEDGRRMKRLAAQKASRKVYLEELNRVYAEIAGKSSRLKADRHFHSRLSL